MIFVLVLGAVVQAAPPRGPARVVAEGILPVFGPAVTMTPGGELLVAEIGSSQCSFGRVKPSFAGGATVEIDLDPAWKLVREEARATVPSHDGRLLLTVDLTPANSWSDPGHGVLLYDETAGTLTLLPRTTHDQLAIGWSANGTHAVFAEATAGGFSVRRYTPANGRVEPYCDVSLASATQRSGVLSTGQLFVVAPDGSSTALIGPDCARETLPGAWPSPDARFVVAVGGSPGTLELRTRSGEARATFPGDEIAWIDDRVFVVSSRVPSAAGTWTPNTLAWMSIEETATAPFVPPHADCSDYFDSAGGGVALVRRSCRPAGGITWLTIALEDHGFRRAQ